MRKRKTAAPERPRVIVAAASTYDLDGGQTWKTFRAGDTAWQAEAWTQYDVNGELSYAMNWLGNACSMASMYVGEIDPDTGEVGEATENATVRAIAEGILGGPAQRSQAQRTMAINLGVPGEFFILVRAMPGDEDDQWMVLSTTEIDGGNGKDVYYHCPFEKGERTRLTPDDMLIRVWTPHPRQYLAANSNVRALLPTLNEIQRASMNIASRLDSRLAGPGILFIPQELDFPTESDDPPGVTGFSAALTRAMAAALNDPGSAAAQVPIVVQIPGEFLGQVQRVTFESPIADQVIELRDKGIQRLAIGMDLPAEMVTGVADVNHWGAWQVEESTYKTHLAPLLDRIADALTTGYLIPALTAAGVPDPEGYALAFDVSALVSRADQFAAMKTLYDERLVSGDALLQTAGVGDDMKPSDEEAQRRLLEELVMGAPTLLADPRVAEALGLSAPVDEAAAGLPAGSAVDGGSSPPGETVAPNGPPAPDGPVTASLVALEAALSRAGNRLLNKRNLRGRYPHVPSTEIHTVESVDAAEASHMLEGAWEGRSAELNRRYDLDAFARLVMVQGVAVQERDVEWWLRQTERRQLDG